MSYTLTDVRTEYDRLDKLCGVDTSQIALKVSSKGVRRHGSCRCSRRFDAENLATGRLVPVAITLGDHIFSSEELFWDVIRHEYAHALVALRDGQKHGHDFVWKRACREVGCDPSRLSCIEMNDALIAKRDERVKYILRCPDCGNEYRYYRRGKVVAGAQQGKMYRCSKCHQVLTFEEM